jgi:hypothetical protein
MLRINYHTGAGNQVIETDDLEDAMRTADAGACYTQQPITIEDAEGNAIAERAWRDVGPIESNDPIRFGTAGHYEDWWLAPWLVP